MDPLKLPWLQLFVALLSTLTTILESVHAATIPDNQILGGTSSSSANPQPDQGISSNSTSVGFTPWPGLPPFGYIISQNPLLAMTYTQVNVRVDHPFSRTDEVVEFVQNFQTELEEHYGRGAEILPRRVGVKLPDPLSATNWHMYFESRHFSKPMVTASTAWTILNVVWHDFKAHGSGAIEIWIAKRVFEYGFAHLTFEFEKYEAVLEQPGCSTNGTFYTCSADGNTDASLQVTR